MEFIALPLPGLILIRNQMAGDDRGIFVKTYQHDLFSAHGIDFVPQEEFYSISHAGVLRGMHFQAPPAACGKIVHCVRGQVHDVALDIRRGSPTYGRSWSGRLDDVKREALYLPPGFAHGFYSLSAEATLSYLVTHPHDPAHDHVIHWDSFDHDWPCARPILSERDRQGFCFKEFSTPFSYS